MPHKTHPTEETASRDAAASLEALLRDLEELRAYLDERGRHTYEVAQRFMQNAQRNPGSRAYDERQATMLEYQHYIWHEIAGLVNKLLVTYGEALPGESPPSDAATTPRTGRS